ncbi:GNAT family N-acetyltransferase [bacterium]|nr:MAG: GNAT family N-acetyltransferase [bacterium]RKZ13725.1 MAG: GNAT family N-acetyltransferase [bacterium]
MTILHTERTVVEVITLADAPFFVALLNSPGWLKFVGDRNVGDVGDAERYLDSGLLQSYRDNGFGYYLVKGAGTGTSIGICGFLKKPNLENPDFGFAFLPDYFGQGLAFESCCAVLEYGIKTFDFELLDAVTVPDNLRSIRLLEKLGFHRHGVLEADTGGDKLNLFRWHGARHSTTA